MHPIVMDRSGLSFCLSVTTVSYAKTAEMIEMPFGMLSHGAWYFFT